MTWNYRVVRRTYSSGESEYSVYEAYYDKDGKPTSITAEPIVLVGTTLEDLRTDYDFILNAFEKPVLDYEDFD